MKEKVYILFCLFILTPFISFAKKVDAPANSWPLEMNSSKNFDIASKCEMLVFIEVFNQFDALSMAEVSTRTKVKNVKENSVSFWKKKTKKRILTNIKSLSNESLQEVVAIQKSNSWEELSKIHLQHVLPSKFQTWYQQTKLFYQSYVKEQIRLAALYPRITSEILQFSKSEIQGHNFTDKHFLLTFDDGPTKVNGNTDKLIKVLNTYDLTGMFFVLGHNLKKRLQSTSKEALINLYGNNTVLSHGDIHKSHQKYTAWKSSIDGTNTLIQDIFYPENKNELLYFRPPYGQRNKQLVNYFDTKNSKIIYWNIDSRDWSSKLNAEKVANRQIKLMLLWRKGILLFHDIHSKSQQSVPMIYKYFKNTGVKWMDSNVVLE
ncbi:polysaccharide deacetylase family protein [Tenacibaculum sp. M341]|uniref:polysaccharide deacetylase family protein n=1 Tax=Tenacibaculum sp. M341 TaxID=2530339 RepID=UPI00104B1C7D|nr:polysaccharide deacetylase family protein [Tenacibaculum sp. M341]TCI94903.1 polysaccharide deacetylase family protein [Tenacibaculum sp. M341]